MGEILNENNQTHLQRPNIDIGDFGRSFTGPTPACAAKRHVAIGLERLSPLAVVVIGGLMFSTFLTLVYVPLFYTPSENIRA